MKMIVLDANILIRAVLGQRVRQILEAYVSPSIRFCAPTIAYEDTAKYLPGIFHKRGKPDTDLPATLAYLQAMVEPIHSDIYSPFEKEARQRLRRRDEEDWPVLALALTFACPIWTEDTDFFGTGVAVWTSDRIEIFLQKETVSDDSEEFQR